MGAASETPDGYTGAKLPKVDRVEVTYIPDGATAVQALNAGEVDVYQFPPNDLLPILERNPDIVVRITNKSGYVPILRPNHLVPPRTTSRFGRRCCGPSTRTPISPP